MKPPLSVILGILLALFAIAATDVTFAQKPIELLEKLPNGQSAISMDTKSSVPALSMLNAYIRAVGPWVIGTSAGLAILMIIIGGFQIMFSGGSDIKSSAGTKRILSALCGLLLLVFAGIILNWLNANYYKLGS